jgi:4-hydroxybenzoate polyprenyltransferase
MLKNLNPVVKFLVMFVIGCIVMFAAEWIASLVKGIPFTVNWMYIIGSGVLIAILDIIYPAEVRKQNRENAKKAFRK